MSTEDRSGQLRRGDELAVALSQVERVLVQCDPAKVDPLLYVELPTIRDALIELQQRRMAALNRSQGG